MREPRRLFTDRSPTFACRWLVWLDLIHPGTGSSSDHWSGRQLVKVYNIFSFFLFYRYPSVSRLLSWRTKASDQSSFRFLFRFPFVVITFDVSSGGSTGRRNKGPNHLCETLLGFVPGVTQSVDWHGEVSLRQRVIVDKLTPGGPLHQGFAHVQQGES